MINVSSEMKSLCEGILTSNENRKKELKRLREETKSIKDNARRFLFEVRSDLNQASKAWSKMSETLKTKRTVSR